MTGRVIQVALQLNDAFSRGLVGVAKNAKKQGADISDGMLRAARQADKFKKSIVSAVDTSITRLGKLAAAAGTAFAAFSFKSGSAFEAQMAKVKSIATPTETQFEALTNAAREMGRVSKYTATEAAQALEYMGMAGWKTQEMIEGLPGVINLAAASGENLATVSDIVTDAMTAFGMGAGEAGVFADVLAQTARSANTNVSLMGETFKYVAPVAGALGFTVEDTAIGIGLMANSGIKASSAGTQLRNLFTNLVKPTEQMLGYMNALGISLDGGTGKAKDFLPLMEELRDKFSRLGDMEKAEFAAGIAGKEGMSGLLAIVNTSQKDFDDLKKQIAESEGAAQEMANILNDTLSGKNGLLKGNITNAGIEFYNAFGEKAKSLVEALNNKLTELTENGTIKRWAENFGDALNKAAELGGRAFDWCREHAELLKTVLGSLAIAVGGIWAGDKVSGFLTSFGKVKDNIGNLLELFGTLSAANGLSGLSNVFDGMAHPFRSIKDMLLSLLGNVMNGFSGLSSKISNAIYGVIELPGKIINGFKALPGLIGGFFQKGLTAVLSFPGKIAGAFKALPGLIGGFFQNGLAAVLSFPGKIAGAFKAIPGLLKGIFNLPAIIGGLSGALAASGIIAVILAIVAVGVALYKNWDTIKAKAAELAAKFKENIMPAVEAVKGLFDKFIALIKENFVPLFQNIADRAQSLGSSFLETLQPAGEAILSVFGALAEFFVNSIVPAFSSIVEVACSLAGSFLEVAVPAIAAVITFAVDLAGKFLEKLKPAVQFVIDVFTALVNFLADILPPVFDKVVEFAQKVCDFFSATFTPIIDGVKNAFQRVKETIEKVINKIRDFLNMDTRKTVQVNYQETGGAIGRNADGSRYWRGGLTWVNERGAEIISFPHGRTIIPAPLLQMVQNVQNQPLSHALQRGEKTLVHLPKGTQIFSHTQSERMIQRMTDPVTGRAIGQNANGSSGWRGGLTWVNEQGAEIIAFPNGNTIVPAPLLPAVQTGNPVPDRQTTFENLRTVFASRFVSLTSHLTGQPFGHALQRGEKTLVHLPKGTQIFSHMQSERIVQHSIGHNADGTGGNPYSVMSCLRKMQPAQTVSIPEDTSRSAGKAAPVIHINVYGRANESDKDFAERIAKAVANYV